MQAPWRSAALLGILALTAIPVSCGGAGGRGLPLEPPAPLLLETFHAAQVVVGQPIFVFDDANQGLDGPGPSTLARPGAPAGDQPFFLPDTGNHRVLGFSEPPFLSHVAARFALGQPGLAWAIAGLGPTALEGPHDAAVDAGRLYVSDTGNHRVLMWEGLPATNAAPAHLALGQPDLVSGSAGAGPSGLRGPAGLAAGGGRLAVCDRLNHRVLLWNRVPQQSGAPADVVLGQEGFDGNAANRGGGSGPGTLNDPTGAWTDGTRLVVADRGNHRVLVWLTWPDAPGHPADIVLGQEHLMGGSPAAGAGGLFLPSDVASNGEQLFVADAGNHRVLVWYAWPLAPGQPADAVLGQSTFQHVAPNDGDQDGIQDPGASARTLRSLDGMLGVSVGQGCLYVADIGNHRLLVFHAD